LMLNLAAVVAGVVAVLMGHWMGTALTVVGVIGFANVLMLD